MNLPEVIELKKKELAVLEAMNKVDFSRLPKDTLCRVSDSLATLASGKGDMRYFSFKANNGALCFYEHGADSKTQVGYTNYKFVEGVCE